MRPCPECKGARLRPESRAVQVAGLAIHEFTAMSARRSLEWIAALELSEQDRAIARLILREIEERLRFLDNVGVGYLGDGPGGGDAVGRRGAADPARDADRLVARRRALHPRRALDRPAPARQRAADRDAGAAARPRQHRARGRARRGHDARRRPRDRHRSGRRRARRLRRGRGHGRGGRAGARVADRAVPLRRAADRGAGAPAAAERVRRDHGRDAAQPEERRCQGAARGAHGGDRRVGLGQVDARQRGALQGGRQPAQPGAACGRARTSG